MITVVGLFEDLRSVRPLLESFTSLGVAQGAIEVLSNDAGDRWSGRPASERSGWNLEGAMKGTAAGIGSIFGIGSMAREGGAATGLDMPKSLEARGVPHDDAELYAECVRRGDTLVAATVDDRLADEVRDEMEDHGAIDIDARLAEFRKSGYKGFDRKAKPLPLADRAKAGEEMVIPLISEELTIGKREVERGRVRLRTYVVERPVEEQVRLREEHVEVERRAATRDVPAGEAFKERSVEITERAEEAVVAKKAVVTEEVVVRKDVTEREQTVRDKARKTEVEIDRGTSANENTRPTTDRTAGTRR